MRSQLSVKTWRFLQVTHRLHTVRVELYNGHEDDVRFAFEIILTLWIFCMMLHTIWKILVTQKEKKNFLKVGGACLPALFKKLQQALCVVPSAQLLATRPSLCLPGSDLL